MAYTTDQKPRQRKREKTQKNKERPRKIKENLKFWLAWEKFEQLGAQLEEGQVAHHAVLLPLTAKQAQQLLDSWRWPLGLPAR